MRAKVGPILPATPSTTMSPGMRDNASMTAGVGSLAAVSSSSSDAMFMLAHSFQLRPPALCY